MKPYFYIFSFFPISLENEMEFLEVRFLSPFLPILCILIITNIAASFCCQPGLPCQEILIILVATVCCQSIHL